MKVFCIGLPKTGTTSIGKAFDILGISHNGATDSSLAIRDICNGSFKYIKEQIEEFNGFEDTPYHLIYEWLCITYPNAKFILTERASPESYLNSLKNESEAKKQSGIHQLKKTAQFGFPLVEGNERAVVDYYVKHNYNAKMRCDNLLVMNFEKGHGWQELCNFLGYSIPNQPFPHENKTKDKNS